MLSLSFVSLAAATRLLIILARENAPAFLQFLHLGYGVGALLVPLLANPFLAVIELPVENKDQSLDIVKVVRKSRVHYAFFAIGLVTFGLSLVFYYFHYGYKGRREYDKLPSPVNVRPKRSNNFLEIINPATYANGSFWFGSFMLILLFIYYFNLVGGEKVVTQFVRSFSVDVFKFNRNDASYLNVSLWLSVIVSKLLMILASSYIPIQKLFKIQIILYLISATVFKLYAAQNSSMLWFCTILQGFTASPLYPSGIAYSNTLLEVKGICLMVIVFAGGFGDMAYIWIAGYLYDNYGPESILNTIQVSGFLLLICIISFKLLEKHKT